jgi:hypothetical protein
MGDNNRILLAIYLMAQADRLEAEIFSLEQILTKQQQEKDALLGLKNLEFELRAQIETVLGGGCQDT